MKFCPHCGAKRQEGAEYCSNCGYRFKDGSKDTPGEAIKTTATLGKHGDGRQFNQQQREPAHHPRKHHGKKIVLTIVVLLLVITGLVAFKMFNQSSRMTSSSNPASSQSTSNNNDSSYSSTTNDSDQSTGESASTTSSAGITAGSSPELDAASIIYYAHAKGLDGWNKFDGSNYRVQIFQTDQDDSGLADSGQGDEYYVTPSADDSTDAGNTLYTIDKDDTVNIYKTDGDTTTTDDPLKSVSKNEIVNYINSHGDASKVKNMSVKIEEGH